MESMKRRDWLKKSACAAAVVNVPGIHLKAETTKAMMRGGANVGVGHLLRTLPHIEENNIEIKKSEIVIVGGGISGLIAGYYLKKQGREDFVILDLEAEVGGNARCGRNEVSAFPTGAHYVTLPRNDQHELIAFYQELGIIKGIDAAGRPLYDEKVICADLQERLFIFGEWIEGLQPKERMGGLEQEKWSRFEDKIRQLKIAIGRDGKYAFTIPSRESSTDEQYWQWDLQTGIEWILNEGLDCESLRWYLDYCCKDEYGMGVEEISAWAMLHYFCSRRADPGNIEDQRMLVFPEGNGFFVNVLKKKLKDHCITHQLVRNCQRVPKGIILNLLDWSEGVTKLREIKMEAKEVILATPRFVAQRICQELAVIKDLHYAPWVVTNLLVKEIPGQSGVYPAWDNVIYQGSSLGYINARHQEISLNLGATVLTHYEVLSGGAKSREWMLTQSAQQWYERTLLALSSVHPDLEGVVEQVEVSLWGHGMISPIKNWMSSQGFQQLLEEPPHIYWAHSDRAGMSNFEEAFDAGLSAAKRLMSVK
jgi:protoporphyrinogen oxidase